MKQREATILFADLRGFSAIVAAYPPELALGELSLGIGMNSATVIACLRGQILVSDTTYRRCEGFVEAGEPIEISVKGHEGGVSVREVHTIPSEGKRVPRQERRGSPRAPVRFAFTYQVLATTWSPRREPAERSSTSAIAGSMSSSSCRSRAPAPLTSTDAWSAGIAPTARTALAWSSPR